MAIEFVMEKNPTVVTDYQRKVNNVRSAFVVSLVPTLAMISSISWHKRLKAVSPSRRPSVRHN